MRGREKDSERKRERWRENERKRERSAFLYTEIDYTDLLNRVTAWELRERERWMRGRENDSE